MISEISSRQVYLACGNTDLRKSIDGLAVLVKEAFNLDPFSQGLFVFCNRKRDKLKILQWDHNGFWLHYRRLERGKFKWPTSNDDTISISYREFRWLLDGLPIRQTRLTKQSKNAQLFSGKPRFIRVPGSFGVVLWYNESMEMQENPTKTIQQLSDKILTLEEQNLVLEQRNAELNAQVKWFKEQLLLSRDRQFAASSEKTSPEQINLFNEAEEAADLSLEEPTIETITYDRRKKQPGHRAEMLKDLPVEEIEYRLPEDQQTCPCCQGPLHEMSTQVRQELKVIPAEVKVIKHIQYIYTCRRCEPGNYKTPIVKAEMPNPILTGSLASPSILAFIMDQKYTNSLPLYRQEQQFSRLGIGLSRQTMANWLLKAADPWLKIIYQRMHEELVKRDILHADETTLQVLKEPGRPAQSNPTCGYTGPAEMVHQ